MSILGKKFTIVKKQVRIARFMYNSGTTKKNSCNSFTNMMTAAQTEYDFYELCTKQVWFAWFQYEFYDSVTNRCILGWRITAESMANCYTRTQVTCPGIIFVTMENRHGSAAIALVPEFEYKHQVRIIQCLRTLSTKRRPKRWWFNPGCHNNEGSSTVTTTDWCKNLGLKIRTPSPTLSRYRRICSLSSLRESGKSSSRSTPRWARP